MGKAKRLRQKAAEKNAKPKHLQPKETQCHPMIQSLSSVNPVVRGGACIALASLVAEEEGPLCVHLLEQGLIKKLIERLYDAQYSVRIHAGGALRNISALENPKINTQMIRDDVLTPVITSVQEIITSRLNGNNDANQIQLLVQLAAVIANLCESDEQAVHVITRNSGIEIFFTLVQQRGFENIELFEIAAQALHITSDTNESFLHRFLQMNNAFELMIPFIQNLSMFPTIQLHLAGTVFNLIQTIKLQNINTIIINSEEIIETVIIPIVENNLQCDVKSLITEFEISYSQAKQSEEKEDTNNKEKEKELKEIIDEELLPLNNKILKGIKENLIEQINENNKQNTEQIIRHWKLIISPIKTSLEILTNFFVFDDDDDDVDETEWCSDDEEKMNQIADQSNLETNQNSFASNSNQYNLSPRHYIIKIMELFQSLIQPLTQFNLVHDLIVQDIFILRQHCSVCFSNLLHSSPLQEIENIPQLFQILLQYLIQGVNEINSLSTTNSFVQKMSRSNQNWLCSLSGLVWTFLKKLHSEHMLKHLQLASEENVAAIITLARSCEFSEIKINCIACIGIFGTTSQSLEFNLIIGQTLLERLEENDVLVQSEAIDALIDVYSSDVFSENFKQLQMLPALQRIAPLFKTKINQESHALDREVIPHLKEVNLNLKRFIKYKINEIL